MDIELEVKKVIIEVLGLEKAPEKLINSTELLGGEIGMNSIMGLQILVLLENTFEFQIDDGDLSKNIFQDVGHLVNYVKEKTGVLS